MSVKPFFFIPAKAGISHQRLRRLVGAAAAVVGGLAALDLIGFVATVYFSAELFEAAEAAGVAELLKR